MSYFVHTVQESNKTPIPILYDGPNRLNNLEVTHLNYHIKKERR